MKNLIKNLLRKEKTIRTIVDPKERAMKIKTTSALISRIHEKHPDEFKTVVIRLYHVNNPHKSGEFPHTMYEFSNTEKVRIMDMNVSYYLEGNDIVINDLEELYIIHEGTKLVLKGYQYQLERRMS